MSHHLPYNVARWALRVIWQQANGKYTLKSTHSIKHVGRCGKCGRPLTTPASLDTGLGEICATELGVEWKERTHQSDDFEGESHSAMHEGLFPSGLVEDNIGHPGHPSNHGDN